MLKMAEDCEGERGCAESSFRTLTLFALILGCDYTTRFNMVLSLVYRFICPFYGTAEKECLHFDSL